jgi:hypothetical protein
MFSGQFSGQSQKALDGVDRPGLSDALFVVTQEGLEPPTPSSEDWCSIH